LTGYTLDFWYSFSNRFSFGFSSFVAKLDTVAVEEIWFDGDANWSVSDLCDLYPLDIRLKLF